MTARPISAFTAASHLLQRWGRVVLLLTLVIAGSVAHMSVMTTRAWATSIERPFDQHYQAQHCDGPSCHRDANHPSACCGSGLCACIFGNPLPGSTFASGTPESIPGDTRLTARPRKGIDRPPKAALTDNNNLPPNTGYTPK
jgi:hypothetical protein